MKISTTTGYAASLYGNEEAVRVLAQAGFDCLDFSEVMGYGEEVSFMAPLDEILPHYQAIKKAADAAGISFGQMHAPFPSFVNVPARDELIYQAVEKSLWICEALSCPYIVVHPAMYKECRYDAMLPEARALNLAFYSRLLPTLLQTHVKIAIENMFGWDPEQKRSCPTCVSTAAQMIELIDALNEIAGETRFVACLDIGHALITGDSAPDMIHELGDRLQLLHVQDNDGIRDSHNVPFTGVTSWTDVMQALRDIHYPGTFSFEAETFMRAFGPRLFKDSVRFQYLLGKDITDNQ
ncbi:MAG: sugar phosphate isomerase/epimerase family protein [Clostridia bacterium]